MGEFLRVKNWTAYQHYNDRQPPWIKAHSKVLDDLEWRSLTDAQKGQLFSIWVLAARIHKDPKTDALVPADPRYLAALTGCQVTEKSLQTIVDKGFLIPCKRDASGVLSDCYPSRDAHAHSASASVSVSEQGESEGDFDRFWDHYPRRVGKIDARKAWKQTAKIRPPIDDLIAALDRLAVSRAWLKDSGQYVPNPATWLRRGGWDDEVRQ